MYSLSKQKTLLRDLWSFHIRSFFHDRSQNISPSDFSVALFALGEDSLMDVLSEAFVLAVSSDAAVSSSIIADMLAFLPKDTFFMSLVKFVIASEERVYLPLISATRHVISALSLHDGDFAASVRSIIFDCSSLLTLVFLSGRPNCFTQHRLKIASSQL